MIPLKVHGEETPHLAIGMITGEGSVACITQQSLIFGGDRFLHEVVQAVIIHIIHLYWWSKRYAPKIESQCRRDYSSEVRRLREVVHRNKALFQDAILKCVLDMLDDRELGKTVKKFYAYAIDSVVHAYGLKLCMQGSSV